MACLYGCRLGTALLPHHVARFQRFKSLSQLAPQSHVSRAIQARKRGTVTFKHKREGKVQPYASTAMANQNDSSANGDKPLKMVLVVAAALIDNQGRVLLAQRPPGKAMAGLWEFPGGKVEAGEAPETALARELREELGVDVECAELKPLTFASHTYDTFHLLMPLFTCTKWSGDPTPLEGQQITWAASDELHTFEMPAADVPLIEPIQRAMAMAKAQ
mmetsp:Transcript_11458/g.23955  ORF Transcript_11458/g.23955 Transcript_11458/m.23955 type:complete len:218 (-) Transcript_11458:269-922(-)|eukprot:CAMPEP_0118924586 /NCGR_PEP_ID=MMETSP1169-20130426/2654_1 /TAXON_ID=36882 /ORGANISM="Pyramimonas obovata, Strain CCMP722" /LENGTH=217 /DNA_ID=CAMNT_0006865713 /DNA_START=113 /DNA_END=766 /DNA_ORIENTATION=-